MTTRRKGSYYRGILRARIPWFVVAALFLAWAWGIYDDRFGNPYVPHDLEERTLSYLDRCLQLEEIAVTQPEIIRQTLFGSDYGEVLQETTTALQAFANEGSLGETGRTALAVALDEAGTPQEDLSDLDETTRSILGHGTLENSLSEALAQRLASPEGTWWDARLAEKALLTEKSPALSGALALHQKRSDLLFRIQLVSSAAWWVLVLGGLAFIPHACRVIRSGWNEASLHRPVRYGSRWSPSVVVALLLAADLTAGYILFGGYFVTGSASIGTGFTFDVFMDSLWRVIAPAIALVVLFRKPRHAIRSLGLDTRPDWRIILAAFSAISLAIFGFSMLTEPWMEFDPTGGLSPMEDGWGGLFYGILSACILAPVAEEIFYRGILFRGLLRRFGFWLSATVVTSAFVLAHSYDFFGLVTIGIFGFAMVVIYRTTGSLTTVILLHALYNTAITLPEWLVYHSRF